MLALTPALPGGRPPRLLCLGAHADDIEIGCGGAVLQLLATHPGTEVHWVVFSGTPERRREAEASAARFLARAAASRVELLDFPDARFPGAFDALKDAFEELKGAGTPDLVFTHRRADRHQDHRTVAELTWNAWRDHLILEYEMKTTACALKGVPSWNLTPRRSLNVQVLPSFETLQDSASPGRTSVFSSTNWTRFSKMWRVTSNDSPSVMFCGSSLTASFGLP